MDLADLNRNQAMDMNEYIKLHEKHPWFAEKLAFMLVNTDNNGFLSRDEIFQASKISPDMRHLNFSHGQLENLVDGLLAIGDKDKDGKVTLDEYIVMSNDVFVDNFAPSSLKRLLK